MGVIVRKTFSKLKTKKQTALKRRKAIQKQHLFKLLSKNFHHFFLLLWGEITSTDYLFSKHLFLDTCFTSTASLYTFPQKRKKRCCKNWQWVFSIFYITELQFGSLVSFNFFLITNKKLLFRSRNYFKSFQCNVRCNCFSVFTKMR